VKRKTAHVIPKGRYDPYHRGSGSRISDGQSAVMPIVSTFFGIVIRMFYVEHGPPHFHAEHQGQRATFTFRGNPLRGTIQSGTALRLIHEWSIARRAELEAN
jgi:hypothetical protein